VALQPGRGKVDGKHYLPSTPETIRWGRLSNAATRPVLTVDSGTTVTFDTVSQEGILEDQSRDPDAFFAQFGVAPAEVLDDARAIAASGLPHRFGIDGPHVVTGPVFVRDARPGDVLDAEIVSLHPRARYGVVSTRHGSGLLAGEFPEGPPPDTDADARRWQAFRTSTTFCAVERRRGKLFGMLVGRDGAKVRFPLAPSLGIMAVGVDVAEPVCSTSAGLHGGALDCRELGQGAHLYLPVQLPGALFSVGDPHYALGEGKAAFSALEGPLRATVRLTALREAGARSALGALREPFVETDAVWMTIGFDADLAEAVRRAARSAVVFLQSRIGLDRADALAYLSSAADLGLCQVVNDVNAAYCRLRRSDFTEPHPQKSRLPRTGFARIVGSGEATGAAAPQTPADEAAADATVAAEAAPAHAAVGEATADATVADGDAPDGAGEPDPAEPGSAPDDDPARAGSSPPPERQPRSKPGKNDRGGSRRRARPKPS
jgi:acetamidase/formamidase